MRSAAFSGYFAIYALGLALASSAGCNKDKQTADPEAGSNLLGPMASGDSDDLGDEGDFDDDEGSGEFDLDAQEGGDEASADASAKKLPPRSKPVERCTGKGKKRTCRMVDPKPKVSAAYGVEALMAGFRWGMTPAQVFKILSKDVEDEYAKRQKQSKDPMSQDRNRKWRQDQLNSIKANHTKFTKGSKHRWGVSLIQFEYEDDSNEEMLWTNSGTGLRKFYFFKDDELWKVMYAYSTDVWPGKSYQDVVEGKFKKWFGPSPKEKVKKEPKSGEPILRYSEWDALGSEKIRSFDMTGVHGVIALTVIDGKAEERIGERLPNMKPDEGVTDVVKDVLGGSDVCYSEDGSIAECSEKEAMGLE